MNKIKWGKISNWLFYMGLLIGALGYYRIFKVRVALPPGVCPVDDNRWMLVVAMILLVASVLVAYIKDKDRKVT